MSKKKSRYSTCVVMARGKVVGYISRRDEESGLDAKLDRLGYSIIAL